MNHFIDFLTEGTHRRFASHNSFGALLVKVPDFVGRLLLGQAFIEHEDRDRIGTIEAVRALRRKRIHILSGQKY